MPEKLCGFNLKYDALTNCQFCAAVVKFLIYCYIRLLTKILKMSLKVAYSSCLVLSLIFTRFHGGGIKQISRSVMGGTLRGPQILSEDTYRPTRNMFNHLHYQLVCVRGGGRGLK